MSKTSTQRQAELIKRRKELGQKQVSTWLNSDLISRLELEGLTKSKSMNLSIQLGIGLLEKIKQEQPLIYLDFLTNDNPEIDLNKLLSLFVSLPSPSGSDKNEIDKTQLWLYKKAYDLHQSGLTQVQIAQEIGKSRSMVGNYIRDYKSYLQQV